MKKLIVLVFALFALAGSAFAAEQMAADVAYSEIGAGRMILVDVRTPAEWKDTGIAPRAIALSMAERDFVKKLKAVVEANPGKRVALICAAGGRSGSVQRQMIKLGIAEDAVDIVEGMKGNGSAPGWIERGLPVVPYQ